MSKLLQLINKLSKLSGYKPNRQKSIAFLYTNKKILHITGTIPFKLAAER
jgi:hypothetical protein